MVKSSVNATGLDLFAGPRSHRVTEPSKPVPSPEVTRGAPSLRLQGLSFVVHCEQTRRSCHAEQQGHEVHGAKRDSEGHDTSEDSLRLPFAKDEHGTTDYSGFATPSSHFLAIPDNNLSTAEVERLTKDAFC
jgi:hypothetical protein